MIRPLPCSERGTLARLLDLNSPADALPTYYALDHPCEKTLLYLYASDRAAPEGFLAIAQTGMDIFRPIIVPFLSSGAALREMLSYVLTDRRPYLLLLPDERLPALEAHFDLQVLERETLYRLEESLFKPVQNVLVVEDVSPDGQPRYLLQSRRNPGIAAGVNWKSGRASEIYLTGLERGEVSEAALRSVASALVQRLLAERRMILIRMPQNATTVRTALEGLGFVSTHQRLALCEVQLRRDDEKGAQHD